MPVDHDQIFKTLFKTFFREFVELFLPEVASEIDFGRVEFLEQESFTDFPGGKRKRLDLVAKVYVKGGGAKHILIHIEFQATKPMEFAARMFEYSVQLYLRYKMPVIPIAVFTDDARWREPVPSTFEIGFKGSRYLWFQYHQIKLKHLDYRQFLGSNNPLAYALMAKMNYNRRERVRLKADFLRLILGVPLDPARRELLLEFVETYIPLDAREEKSFNSLVVKQAKFKEVKRLITTYEKRGIEKGIEKGIAEGCRKARQDDLILLLEKKFGEIQESLVSKIRRVRSQKRLEKAFVSAIEAETLSDLKL